MPVSPIRALARADLPQVVSLYEAEMGSGSRTAPPGMAEHFARLFLDSPWVDPEIPALVYEDGDGRIGAFLGSSVRRMVFDGRPLRAGCPGPVFTEPGLRPLAALLIRTYSAGRQDLTLSDRQSMPAQRLIVRLGADVMHLQCFRWTRVFQPMTFKATHLAHRRGAGGLAPLLRPAARGLDRLSAPLAAGRRVEPSNLRGEALTPRALVEHLDAVAGSFELRPDPTEPFVAWLFGELRKLTFKGCLTPVLVRDRAGRVVGWYVYFLKPGGLSEVAQIAASEASTAAVLQHLFHHAAQGGAAALRGRLEPRLHEPLRTLRCTFHQQSCLLVHTTVPGLLDAIRSGRALLGMLDGEVWVRETLPAAAPRG